MRTQIDKMRKKIAFSRCVLGILRGFPQFPWRFSRVSRDYLIQHGRAKRVQLPFARFAQLKSTEREIYDFLYEFSDFHSTTVAPLCSQAGETETILNFNRVR